MSGPYGRCRLHVEGPNTPALPSVRRGQHVGGEVCRLLEELARPQSLYVCSRVLEGGIYLHTICSEMSDSPCGTLTRGQKQLSLSSQTRMGPLHGCMIVCTCQGICAPDLHGFIGLGVESLPNSIELHLPPIRHQPLLKAPAQS